MQLPYIVFMVTLQCCLLSAAFSPPLVQANPDTHVPTKLSIENQTEERFLGKIFGHYVNRPALPHNVRHVSWQGLKLLCKQSSPCAVDIMVNPKEPTEQYVGTVHVDLDTGDISPRIIHGAGYRIENDTAASRILITYAE